MIGSNRRPRKTSQAPQFSLWALALLSACSNGSPIGRVTLAPSEVAIVDAAAPSFVDFAPGMVSTITSGLTGADGLVQQADGTFLVSDPAAGTVTAVTLTGETTLFASGLVEPFGMSQDSAGNVLVADWGARSIKRISPAGKVTEFARLSGRPGNVFVDSQDTVYLPSFFSG